MSKVTLDYSFAASKNVECGISPEELDTLLEKARYGFSKLTALVNDDKVGFTKLPYQNLDQIKALARDINCKYNDLVVIGVGGAALGIEAIVEAILPLGYSRLSFADRRSFPRFWVLDNSDPSNVGSVMRHCRPEDTFVLMISKSGQTIETAANFAMIIDWMKKAAVDIKKHVAVVAHPERGSLNAYAKESGLPIFPLETNISGQFPVLSPASLLPAAILGINIDKLLAGAASVVESDWKQFLTTAAIYMHYMKTKPINVLMPYTSRLSKFADWFNQLWAESLGQLNGEAKLNFGTTPVSACGSIDQHALLQLYLDGPADKFITFLGVGVHDMDAVIPEGMHDYLDGVKLGELLNTQLKSTEALLLSKGRSSMRFDIPSINETALGELFMLFQYVVAIIALSEDIDPFKQPAVELGKQFTYGLIDREGYEQKKEQFEKIYVKSSEFIV
ncbi:MAG: glucose-6-phosphate isomerase [Deferribacteraceae bacterium]|jgi:glucose-6-phosphate isomerase|nr:glucose-6-phosphate isomerase [Deferribacteraceae bacterium]